MARIKRLAINGYRSIKDRLQIAFPTNLPVVLVGENNAGKSNIIRALDLILGEFWPKSRDVEDHDCWDRNPANVIEIALEVENLSDVASFHWRYDPNNIDRIQYQVRTVHGNNRYPRNDDRDQLICVTVGADRRLSYQLSYSNKWTLLSKLMRKFHARLTQDPQRVVRLKEKFGEIQQIFKEVAEFGNFQTDLAAQFTEMLAGMSYGLGIDFSAYDPSNYFHSLKVFPQEGTETRTFDELGTGQEQVLALAFAHAYAKAFFGGIVLIIEEPEAHLHPLAQQWLSKRIRQLAADGLQVVITTHSPAFVSMMGLEGLVLVRKEDGTTAKQLDRQALVNFCVQHGASAARTNANSILPFYESSATQEILSGLFAKKIVLVEGPTEALALPIYLSKIGFDITKSGIAIVPVWGKGNLSKWWRLFRAYDLPVYAVFDNDRGDDADGRKRAEFLATLGFNPENIQQYIDAENWLVEGQFCVFGRDFETQLREAFPAYAQLEEEARRNLGSAKPLIARDVAGKLVPDATEGWQRVASLRDAIQGL